MQNFFGKDGFVWWKGVCEDRKDPLKLGRYKIRIFGWHTQDKSEMPTEALPWAHPSLPLDHGKGVVGLREGDWCWGFFRDADSAQEPVVVGFVPGIPEEKANPEIGFFDPTPDDQLTPQLQPRPPEYSPPQDADGDGEDDGEENLGRFSDPNVLPGENVAFGELTKDYDAKNYKWDANKDGTYNAEDAKLIIDPDQDGKPGVGDNEFGGGEVEEITYPMSRYPLEQDLLEPITSRLSRNENIEKTLVTKKKGGLANVEAANHPAMGIGSDEAYETEPTQEPETPYAAVYPFNHVYESESGHVKEIDDTPGAERLHDYHRSGTFIEVHPDGTRVVKGVKKGFNVFVEDFFFQTLETAAYHAAKDFLIKAGAVMNLESGADMNIDSGANTNHHCGGDHNTLVGKNVYTVIEGDVRILVKGNYNLAVEGDIMIKAKGDILMDGTNIRSAATGFNIVNAGAAVITEGPITYSASPVTDGVNIHATFADAATVATPGVVTSQPHIQVVNSFVKENDADNKQNLVTSSTPKEGFILYGPAGDLYKPISDSTGNVVTLSETLGAPHFLYQALPTGELQTVTVEYKHKDGTITSWEIIRPVHRRGAFIEAGVYSGNGNGGRDHYRFSKPGAEYPTQMILNIADRDYLLLDAGVRHEAFGGTYQGY